MAALEARSRSPAEHLACPRDVGDGVADVASPERTRDLESVRRSTEQAQEMTGGGKDRRRMPAADVDRKRVDPLRLPGPLERVDNVVDEDDVADNLAVLVDVQRAPLEDLRAEDRSRDSLPV